jgi:sarcosine oxidase subunit gamma
LIAALKPRSAFAGLRVSPAADRPGRALVATVRDGMGMASLGVRRGQRAALAQRVAANLGLVLPEGPRRVAAKGMAAAGVGPCTWLITAENAGNVTLALQAAVGDSASVADQSDAYAVLRLAGSAVRATLSKLLPIDLHPRAFAVGDVAGTVAAHIGAVLWRLPDGADGEPVMELAVYRSMAAAIWHELAHHGPLETL